MSIVGLLDACVIYPAPIRDLLLRLAEAEVFTPKWTEKIHEEWTRNLLANRSDLDPKRIQRTVNMMNEAFPYSLVEDYESLIPALELPDPADRHVLAAAISGQAKYLVTANIKDFPFKTCSEYQITPIHPDDFIVMLLELAPDLAYESFKQLVKSLKNPPQSIEQVLKTLENCDLPKSVLKLKWLQQRDNLAY